MATLAPNGKPMTDLEISQRNLALRTDARHGHYTVQQLAATHGMTEDAVVRELAKGGIVVHDRRTETPVVKESRTGAAEPTDPSDDNNDPEEAEEIGDEEAAPIPSRPKASRGFAERSAASKRVLSPKAFESPPSDDARPPARSRNGRGSPAGEPEIAEPVSGVAVSVPPSAPISMAAPSVTSPRPSAGDDLVSVLASLTPALRDGLLRTLAPLVGLLGSLSYAERKQVLETIALLAGVNLSSG